ncbi:hypothetical protein SSX86_000898 [Deinandra increscens subsp. villosa]|uniref:DUF7138 domain-containing protein n=1 Tax=Deinandra increscens subsp. villosa TaxID=3103831 RepID=A0AAP0H8Q7_9ASTR
MVQEALPELAVEFPVVLFNGERQINVGNIEIHPAIDYLKFRTMLKHMIGVSYNNLTTYFVEKCRPSSDNLQSKILITKKADFSAFVHQKNAYFLVVVKRTRRRKISNRIGTEISPEDLFDYSFEHREIGTQVPESGKVAFWLHQLEMERVNKKMMNLVMMDGGLKCDLEADLDASFPSVAEAYPVVERPMSRESCEECEKAMRRGWKPGFHLCVYDDVVEGFFRSPAGPVSRSR